MGLPTENASNLPFEKTDVHDLVFSNGGKSHPLLEGNRRYKIRIPLADTTGDPFVPHSLKAVTEDMKRRTEFIEKMAQAYFGELPQEAKPGETVVGFRGLVNGAL